MIHFRTHRSGTEEQRTKAVAPQGSEQKGEQGSYSEQSAPGSTRQLFSLYDQGGKKAQHCASPCCKMLCLLKALCCHMKQTRRRSLGSSGIFCWCCLLILYRKTTMTKNERPKKTTKTTNEHFPLLLFPDIPLYLLIFLEKKKIRFDNVI